MSTRDQQLNGTNAIVALEFIREELGLPKGTSPHNIRMKVREIVERQSGNGGLTFEQVKTRFPAADGWIHQNFTISKGKRLSIETAVELFCEEDLETMDFAILQQHGQEFIMATRPKKQAASSTDH